MVHLPTSPQGFGSAFEGVGLEFFVNPTAAIANLEAAVARLERQGVANARDVFAAQFAQQEEFGALIDAGLPRPFPFFGAPLPPFPGMPPFEPFPPDPPVPIVVVDGGATTGDFTLAPFAVGASAQLPIIPGSREDPRGPSIPGGPVLFGGGGGAGFSVNVAAAIRADTIDDAQRAGLASALPDRARG